MKPQPFRFEVTSLSDPGRVRSLNEDAVTVDRELGFAAVTDGMGGHRAGEVASRLALDAVTAHLRGRATQALTPQWVASGVTAANAAVRTAVQKQTLRTGMGTTLAMAVFDAQNVVLAHVGDSRIYRLRAGRLELLTRDDSILNDQIELGLIKAEEVSDSRNRRVVTQTLGMAQEVNAHIREEALHAGDVYLLCSDGLNDLVGEKDIELIIDSLKTNLPLTATHLVQLANDSGGYDNVTVALVRVLGNDAAAQSGGWLSRMLGRWAH